MYPLTDESVNGASASRFSASEFSVSLRLAKGLGKATGPPTQTRAHLVTDRQDWASIQQISRNLCW
jgi:hypothetical protein